MLLNSSPSLLILSYTMNLPNLITISRLLLTPYIVWLLLIESYFLGFIFFLISGISDALDGFIAKRFNQKTLLGSYLDPIADKFLIVSAIVLLGYNGSYLVNHYHRFKGYSHFWRSNNFLDAWH